MSEKKGCVDYCTCTNTDCENHSICCKCVLHHKGREYPPFCLRPPEAAEGDKA